MGPAYGKLMGVVWQQYGAQVVPLLGVPGITLDKYHEQLIDVT